MELSEWINKIGEDTLTVVDNLGKISEFCMKYKKLCTKSPLTSDDISELRDIMEKIQMTISTLMSIFVPRLSEKYRIVYPGLISMRGTLIASIQNADSRNIHPNTNVTHYDEENLISEITQECENSLFGHVIGSMHMDQIIEPNQYSNVALVKRLTLEGGLYQDIMVRTLNSISKMKSHLGSMSKSIHDVSEFLDSSESSCLYEAERTSASYERLAISGSYLGRIIHEMKFAFTILSELYHNLTVYKKAVDSYTSVVMESAFGDQYNFEIM